MHDEAALFIPPKIVAAGAGATRIEEGVDVDAGSTTEVWLETVRKGGACGVPARPTRSSI